MEEKILGIIEKLVHVEEEKLYFVLKIIEDKLDKNRGS